MVKHLKTKLSDLVASLRFWWAKKTIRENIDFKYVINESHTNYPSKFAFSIELLRRPYDKMIIEIGDFIVTDPQQVDFTTLVKYNPNNIDVFSFKFNRFVTNIIRLIISNSAEVIAKELHENRDDDIVESDEERTVPEKSDTVSEKRVSKRKPRKKTVSGNTEILPKVQQPTKSKRTKTTSGRKKRSD